MTREHLQRKPSKKSVSLVLGSGGARGIAHIGVIECLRDFGYRIESVAGCSMGAVIGGIYAAGKLKDYELWLRKLSRTNVVSLIDLSFTRTGLVKGNKVIRALIEIVGDQAIEELAIPYTAVATDIGQFKEVWIQKGPLFRAIRASMSLPLLMTPYHHNGSLLIDGGVLNPVPIAPTFSDDTDITIAVNLGGPPAVKINIKPQDTGEEKPLRFDFFSRKSTSKETVDDLSLYDISNRAFDAMQTTIARQKLAAYPPDILIEIPRDICKTHEFHRANEIIEIGYRRAYEVLNSLYMA